MGDVWQSSWCGPGKALLNLFCYQAYTIFCFTPISLSLDLSMTSKGVRENHPGSWECLHWQSKVESSRIRVARITYTQAAYLWTTLSAISGLDTIDTSNLLWHWSNVHPTSKRCSQPVFLQLARRWTQFCQQSLVLCTCQWHWFSSSRMLYISLVDRFCKVFNHFEPCRQQLLSSSALTVASTCKALCFANFLSSNPWFPPRYTSPWLFLDQALKVWINFGVKLYELQDMPGIRQSTDTFLTESHRSHTFLGSKCFFLRRRYHHEV